MLGIFSLLFESAALLKDEFVDMSINDERRTNAFKKGNLYYTDMDGKSKLVDTNELVHREVYNGDMILRKDKDGTIVHNYSEAQRQKAAKADSDLNEKNRQDAIRENKELYIYNLPRKYKENYNVDSSIAYFLKSVKTDEVFGSIKWNGKGVPKTAIYPIVLMRSDPTKKGFITTSKNYGSSFRSVIKDGRAVYERVNDNKSLIL